MSRLFAIEQELPQAKPRIQELAATLLGESRAGDEKSRAGDSAPALMDLVESGTIRILSLLFVMKDAEGAVTTIDIADLDPEAGPAFLDITVTEPGALGPDDADEVAEDLPLDSPALLVAFENTWAAKFVEACRAADAVVIDQIRIPADVAEEALAAS